MSNVIIIEGPDGAGKTHLAARLMLRDYAYRHEGPTPDGVDALQYYGRKLLDALAENRNVVFDRFHLGAYVYGPIHRRRIEMSDQELTVFDRFINARAVRLIVALPRWSFVLANWTARRKNEMIDDERRLLKIYEAFEISAQKRNYERWSYEDSAEPPIYRSGRGPTCDVLDDNMIGSVTASHLFVGERTNGGLDLPFFSMKGCAGYLNRAIWKASYREDQIAFVNALNARRKPNDLGRALTILRNVQRIILLGRIAERVFDEQVETKRILRSWEPDVRRLPHPQYWKRFHHHDVKTYVRLLKEARA